jgi:geranylgeranyl diphosphate synthase, type II
MNNLIFLEILKNYQDLLWPVIEKAIIDANNFPVFCSIDKKYQSVLDFHLEIVSDYPRRKGKYLRPSLLLLAAQAMGVDLKSALNTAAAMQISEDWILNHDDIEDDSPDRRGQPALHKIYGHELALNAGDALHLIMWQVLFNNYSSLSPELSSKIINEFGLMLNRTVLGQEIELKWAKDNRFDLTDEDNFLVLESKTGYYTIAGPMRLGAILGGATDNQLNKIYKFGVLLGRSFQIIDDYLDLTSDFAGSKKVKGNDIYENKRTIMLLHLIRHASQNDLSEIIKILAKSRTQKTPEDIVKIISLMDKYGSLNYAQDLAKKFATEAKEIFSKDLKFLKIEPYRSQIEAGIDFIVTRDH